MITRNETKQLQGMAVLAMLVLHLFSTLTPSYTPIVYATGVPLAYFFGQAADFCVMSFCFCSGYGLMENYIQCGQDSRRYFRGRLRSLRRFLTNYWLILFLFGLIALLLGKGKAWLESPQKFLGNFLTLWYSYNGAWWFVSTYVFMVLLSPIVLKIVQKRPALTAAVAPFLYLFTYKIRFGRSDNFVFQHLARLGMSYSQLLVGVYFCKYDLMSRIQKAWNKLSAAVWRIGFLCQVRTSGFADAVGIVHLYVCCAE